MSNVLKFEEATAPITASISSSAMLVEFTASVWTARKLDRKVSNEVTRQKNADAGVANVTKNLLGNCHELIAVQKHIANARNRHYEMTMPWSDTGMRLLPITKYFDYHKEMTGMQNEFERLVNDFLSVYGWEKTQAQMKLGDMFDANEYPSEDRVRHKFGFRLSYIPLPDSGDWRVDVTAEAKAQLVEHYNTFYRDQLTNAMNDVWRRAYAALSRMSERLDYTSQDKKIFRDTLVDNVMDVVELLKDCNITNDMQMSAMYKKLQNAMMGVTAEGLREDDGLRRETKKAVDDAIKALPSLEW